MNKIDVTFSGRCNPRLFGKVNKEIKVIFRLIWWKDLIKTWIKVNPSQIDGSIGVFKLH
jgi:hypothetical protein